MTDPTDEEVHRVVDAIDRHMHPIWQAKAAIAAIRAMDREKAKTPDWKQLYTDCASVLVDQAKQIRELYDGMRDLWPYKDLIEAGQHGQEDMRERAAKLVEPDSAIMASKIRAIPLERDAMIEAQTGATMRDEARIPHDDAG